jgi:hypothetical protein
LGAAKAQASSYAGFKFVAMTIQLAAVLQRRCCCGHPADAHPADGRLGPLTIVPYFTILVTARSQIEEAGAAERGALLAFFAFCGS